MINLTLSGLCTLAAYYTGNPLLSVSFGFCAAGFWYLALLRSNL